MHQNKKTGVLLVNLGTPKSYSPKDVGIYLKEFLLDPRVIDVPFLIRQALVRFLIVPRRKKRIAATYKDIWTKEGSPLLMHGNDLKTKLQDALGEQFHVALAMRYQTPSIANGLEELKNAQVHNMTILPLLPQYASATTGSILEEVMKLLLDWNVYPSIKMLSHFYDHPLYIKAIAAIGKRYTFSDYDHILFSFHGLPLRHLDKAREFNPISCYRRSCYTTAQLIAEELNLPRSDYTVSFQSRLGKEEWCQPYTSDTVKALGRKGVKKLLVFSPAFVADCLETLYEVKIELEAEFKEHGGERIDLVEGLNSDPLWVEALKSILKDNL